MTSARRTIAVAVTCIAAFLCDAKCVQAQSEEPLPVSLKAAPIVAWVHRPVTLSGNSISAVPRSAVTLRITRPSSGKATPAVMNVPLDLSGNFSVTYSETDAPGLYRVQATAPDGRGVADSSFRVVDAAGAADNVDALTEVGPAVTEILSILEGRIDQLPPSPAKDELVRDLGELDRKMLSFVRDAPRVRDETKLLLDVSGQAKLPEKLAAERDSMLTAFNTAKEWISRTPAEETRLRQQQTTCDNLEVIVEGFKFASFLLNFAAGGPMSIAQNFLGDLIGYAAGKGADAAGASDTGSFGTSALGKNATGSLFSIKHGASGVWLSLTNGLAGNMSDLSSFAASKVMTAYCEQFTGPMKAHMKAQFFKDDQKWWEYEFDLRGKTTVHYPKDATGSSIPLKGRLEGYAYNFKVWENALTVLYPTLMSSAVQKRIVIPPFDVGEGGAIAGTEYIEGSVVGAAAPNSFFFEVTGTARKDQLLLNIGATRTDIDAKARVIALSLSPLSIAITFHAFVLPYKPAHFIFERAADQYIIGLKTEGSTIRGKQHFERDVPRTDADGHYSVDLEVCNPNC